MSKTYTVRRFFAEGHPAEVIATGLTLDEAQAHCRDEETNSRTATSESAKSRTAEFGPWFDGYDEE
jgi:hypothetical protein